MRIRPLPFLLKLIPLFFLVYWAWGYVAPWYMPVFVFTLKAVFSASGTTIIGPSEIPAPIHARLGDQADTALFYHHDQFASMGVDPQGIPAEWIIANVVLLVPLMLATPAPTWRARFGRLALALAIALVLQVFDVFITIQAVYASRFFVADYGDVSRWLIQFLNGFIQGYDTQLFPFAVWAGIHFRDLIATATAGRPAKPRDTGPSRAERRRAQK